MLIIASANKSIDEMISTYYDRNRQNQFIRDKPIHFGYEMWALCGSDGDVSLNCGQESDARNDTLLGTRVVMKLKENFVNPSSYTLYFDNYLTSIDLLKSLSEQETYEKIGSTTSVL
ncbi:zinc finger protein [Trichonephila clavipes]|nr:zinc finger protein [Trichonephila clavipes]